MGERGPAAWLPVLCNCVHAESGPARPRKLKSIGIFEAHQQAVPARRRHRTQQNWQLLRFGASWWGLPYVVYALLLRRPLAPARLQVVE